ncbi:AraC family transcriptional regulator [Alcanivorax hongdengensis A-11-3]|uniref:AraC family transcriptional regulator n=1 Tax=Alcanivorax hongdengensis A-11-3 TaxID=1177179 RepID=L0WD61_9GAMM|nr:AraC family transcriptional regulator [Alcanivorax hongdengensis]EKF73700.1 AraC family transcriptional regulator [Alcanivorax hongdengensis A-11-3]
MTRDRFVQLDPGPARSPVSVNYVRNLLELIGDVGVDTQRLLDQVGLSEDEVYNQEPALRFEQFSRVMLGAREMTGDPALGLLLGQQLTLTAHGLLGYAAISSDNLGDALRLLERYFRTRTRLCIPRLEPGSQWVRFCLAESMPLGPIRETYLEVVTAALVGGIRYLLGDRFRDATLELPYPAPHYAERYRALLDMPVQFNAEVAALRLPASLLDEPFTLADRASRQMAAQKCEEELQKLEADQDWASRVRARLMQAEGMLPSLEQLAGSFHVTSRTLRRYLNALGVSYRSLLEEVRMAKAMRYLQANITVQQVANKLGYADPSNFARAFRKWTGHPPSHFQP